MPQALEDTVTNRPCVSSTYESLIMVGAFAGYQKLRDLRMRQPLIRCNAETTFPLFSVDSKRLSQRPAEDHPPGLSGRSQQVSEP